MYKTNLEFSVLKILLHSIDFDLIRSTNVTESSSNLFRETTTFLLNCLFNAELCRTLLTFYCHKCPPH